MGPFMVEIVFCRVTRRGRKKGKGMNKLARENMRNDGPMQSFIPKDDMLKVTLDLSDNGPVFGALDEMMMRLSMEGDSESKKKKGSGDGAKKALKNLLRSGIPGIEGMFGGEDPTPRFGKKGGKKGFHKMNDGSKKKFMTAIFGEDGAQIDSSTAAALLAATCSQGNPEIGNRLAELLLPNMGETVDPAMMGALMSACSLINAGAGTEEVMKAMIEELSASGLSEEEILQKTQILMKAFGKEDLASTAEYKLLSNQKNLALKKAGISPKDFTAIMLAHKAIAACGTTPENIAKIFIIKSTLAKKGGNPQHIANALINLGQISDEVKAEVKEKILAAWGDSGKLGKVDVGAPVRMHLALDNENEPGWVEVKNLKDVVCGVSPTSQEAIELNLARATKSGGLKKDDIGRANMALKAISLLGVDPVQLAKILYMEKTICDNGVPAVEVGRVLSDGMMPPAATQGLVSDIQDKLTEDLKPADIDSSVKVYNNLKIKGNLLTEVVEYVDKTLIQVRCSLEDVADNMISTMRARGEKEMKIAYDVTDTLKKTGASASVVSATIMIPLKELTGRKETELTKLIGRNLKEVQYSDEDVKGAVTEMVIKIIEDDSSQYQEACGALESIFKDLGVFTNTIKEFISSSLPPPPTPPEEVERRLKIAEELERLTRAEEERERLKALGAQNPPEEEDEDYDMVKPRNKKLDVLMNGDGSRRGSLVPPPPRSRQGSINIGGLERRGSYYDDGVTQRATVAMITDDPEHKKNLKQSLSGVFNGELNGHGVDIPEGLEVVLSGLPEGASPEMIEAALKAAGMTDTGGVMGKLMRGVSAESRALMQQILSSTNSQDEISSRVAALLAGTALSTSRGEGSVSKQSTTIQPVSYDVDNANLSTVRRRRDGFQMPDLPDIQVGENGYGLGDSRDGSGVLMRELGSRAKRGSIKRQSELLRESQQKAKEREEERQRKQSYYRKVTGLRRAKVPLMVYSCGGFSRCFRVARFYDVEGPPVGVLYERPEDERKALNPDL